jgi:hypothetical protein
MTDAAVFSRLPFPSIFFFLSRALPYIYLPPNVMMLYIRASAPPTRYSILLVELLDAAVNQTILHYEGLFFVVPLPHWD